MTEEIEIRDGVCCATCHFTKTGYFTDTIYCIRISDDISKYKLCNQFIRKEVKKE